MAHQDSSEITLGQEPHLKTTVIIHITLYIIVYISITVWVFGVILFFVNIFHLSLVVFRQWWRAIQEMDQGIISI